MNLKQYLQKITNPTKMRPHARRGQSMVEFALLLPLLVLIVFGVADLGRAFQSYIAVTNASRVGARQAILNPSNVNYVKAAAVAEAKTLGITINESDVIVTCDPCTHGNPMRVTVSYQFFLVTRFVFSDPIIIERYTEMMVP